MSIEELLGIVNGVAWRGYALKLRHHLERVSARSKPKQRAVMEVFEAILAQSAHD